jgi:hypothetical protein
MNDQNPLHKNPTKGAVQGREALGTPSRTERKHYRAPASKADASPKKGELLPIGPVERRAIRFPNRIGGK